MTPAKPFVSLALCLLAVAGPPGLSANVFAYPPPYTNGPGRLHLVIGADTADASVGDDMKFNVRSLRDLFEFSVPPADLNVVEVVGSAYAPRGLLERIASVPVGPDDALVVIVMGHGEYDRGRGSWFDMGPGGALWRSQVREAVERRGARLSAFFTDSCNNYRVFQDVNEPIATTPAPPTPPAEWTPGFQRLFRESRGLIDLTSCSPGEFSFCYPTIRFRNPTDRRLMSALVRGSLFTQALASELQGSGGDATWQKLVDATIVQTESAFREAYPTGFATRLGGGAVRQHTQTVRPVALQVSHASPPPATAPLPNRLGARVVPSDRGLGVKIEAVPPDSPAARRGFKPGEVIERVGARVVNNPEEFAEALEEEGDLVQLSGWNLDGTEFTNVFRLAARPPLDASAVEPPSTPRRPVLVESLGGEVAEGPDGLVVGRVLPHGVAAAHDFEAGDTIRAVETGQGMVVVNSAADLRDALDRASDRSRIWISGVDRGDGAAYFLPIDFVGPRAMRLGVLFDEFWNSTGAKLRYVYPNFPAAEHGLRAGDLIQAINGEVITSLEHARAVLARSPRVVSLAVVNGGTALTKRHEIEMVR